MIEIEAEDLRNGFCRRTENYEHKGEKINSVFCARYEGQKTKEKYMGVFAVLCVT